MVIVITSTTEKRGVVLTFLSELLFNSKILCMFAEEGGKGREMVQKIIAESDLATMKDLEAQNVWIEADEKGEGLKIGRGPR